MVKGRKGEDVFIAGTDVLRSTSTKQCDCEPGRWCDDQSR